MTVNEKKKRGHARADSDGDNDNKKKRKTCTNGDAYMNMVVKFTRLKLLATQSKDLLESLSSNDNLCSDKSSSSSNKNIMNATKLVSKVFDKMVDEIDELVYQNKLCYVTRGLMSYSVARINTEVKRENMFQVKTRNKKCTTSQRIKKLLEKDYLGDGADEVFNKDCNDKYSYRSRPMKKRLTVIKHQQKTSKLKINLPVPTNNCHLTKREMINFYLENKDKAGMRKLFEHLETAQPPIIGCSLPTFKRVIKLYNETNVLPKLDDDGMQVGRPQNIAEGKNHQLNNRVKAIKGLAENFDVTKENYFKIKQEESEECNDFDITNKVNSQTVMMYAIKATISDPEISFVLDKTSMVKCSRRQMASMSVRNLMSHLCAISYGHFIPSVNEWAAPRNNLTRGAKDFLQLIKCATGINVKPVKPQFILNIDATSLYLYEGVVNTGNVYNLHKWARVDNSILERSVRNKSSYYKNDENGDKACKGIRVKYICGAFGCGSILPIVMQFTGLSQKEMPTKPLVVMPVPGLCINGHIDLRSEELGYVIFMRKDCKQLEFFEWYNENITYPGIKNLRRIYGKSYSTASQDSVDDDIEILDDERVIEWGDSDIPYISQLNSPEKIERNLKRGVYNAKIGAKITECVQPLDVGPFFKCMKSTARSATTIDSDCPIRKRVINDVRRLSRDKLVILSTVKNSAVVDCIASSPEIQSKSFSVGKVQDSFVDTGMLDMNTKQCPDMIAIMNSFKIPWGEVPGGKKWFVSKIRSSIKEMYENGYISEEFFDNNDFPVDKDLDGNEYPLTSVADHMVRSKIMWHKNNVQIKKDKIQAVVDAKKRQQNESTMTAEKIITDNKTCEEKLLQKMNLPPDTVVTTDTFSLVNLELFNEPNRTELAAFVLIRTLKDLSNYKKVYIPRKGTADEVTEGIRDRKGGPLLVEMAFDSRAKVVIGMMPDLTETEPDPVTSVRPTIVNYQDYPMISDTNLLTVDWCKQARVCIESLSTQNKVIFLQHITDNIQKLNDHCDIAVKHMLKRLPKYLSNDIDPRIPSKRDDLLPGKHWVWSSFTSKLKKIAAIMILSYHLADLDDLLTRDDNENLFNKINFFKDVQSMIQNSLKSDFDGSYLCFDSKRQIVIRSGAAQSGMKKRWKEHVSASMCATDNSRSSHFYSSYPSINCKEVDKPKQSLIKGNFQQIVQLVGVALHRSNEEKVVDLFEWSDYEIEKLGELSAAGSRESIQNKKYRHMCYMFELAYALCIASEKNISSNPGCEWQLRFYGK